MYLLFMIKARIRWCTCRVENILTFGKLLSLWFCFLLHSILFLILKHLIVHTKIISSYELARPIMGTIFLVVCVRCCLHGAFLTLSTHAREDYSSHVVCPLIYYWSVSLSVFCHFFILDKATFAALKLTSLLKSFKCSTFLKIEAILEKKRVELRP